MRRTNHDVYAGAANGSIHVLFRISKHLQLILGVHEILLSEFGAKFQHWDSRSPNFASILAKHAEFLKICADFLKEKRNLADELTRAMETVCRQCKKICTKISLRNSQF